MNKLNYTALTKYILAILAQIHVMEMEPVSPGTDSAMLWHWQWQHSDSNSSKTQKVLPD